MNVVITSVDHAPDDLDDQLPIRARLVRILDGKDRSGRSYWLSELVTPISWNTDGVARTITHLLIAARWMGTTIEPGAKIPINICYVTSDALVTSAMLDLRQAEYVAIGIAKISGRSLWTWLREKLKRADPKVAGREA